MIVGTSMNNIFDSCAHTLVCPVNTVGVMGAGLAKQFARRYPSIVNDYRQDCRSGNLTVEKPCVYHFNDDEAVLCFATKKHWKNDSQIDWIRSGLNYLANHYKDMGIKSLAVPMLGCGLGQLDWWEVYPIVYECLDPIPILVETVEPLGDPPKGY